LPIFDLQVGIENRPAPSPLFRWDNEAMPLGIYLSVPFCRSKCSYCNFASGVASRGVYERFVAKVCEDVRQAEHLAHAIHARLERQVDSIYLGGGTPTVLEPEQLARLFAAMREQFDILPDAEVTVECAPGSLSSPVLDGLLRCGVNRISLGVQSWVDAEAAAVGRLHTRTVVQQDIQRLREAGVSNINLDLIAGLPHQTAESWRLSLTETISSGVPHVSVYMLEVDEDSRLGRELLAGGVRYHAHFVPNEDACADFYLEACERLEEAGIQQYEISNFARYRDGQWGSDVAGTGVSPLRNYKSRHNLKYWTRQPYLGFGVDAHSMLRVNQTSSGRGNQAVRFATPDELEGFLSGTELKRSAVDRQAALEETFFLGLRLNQGVSLDDISVEFGDAAVSSVQPMIAECVELGLMEQCGGRIRLTARGRLLSNEVFERFIAVPGTPGR
jgi:putative oxygen-independent coproporphyrinogen III oxidase